MGARKKDHPECGVGNRGRRRRGAGQSAGQRPTRQRNSKDLTELSEQENPFGPQSHWSSLLCEREYLQDEIIRGEKYLRQLHREAGTVCALMESWTGNRIATAHASTGLALTEAVQGLEGNLERSLKDWLDRLQQRLEAVTRGIDVVPIELSTCQPASEESVFTLLRGVG